MRPAWGLVIVAGLAVALAVIVSGLTRVAVGPGANSEVRSIGPTQSSDPTTNEGALPVPDGNTVVAVLDPDDETPPTSADEAVRIARADGSNLVGASPRVQLVRMSARRPDSPLDGFVGWIVLSTDVQGYLWGPYIPSAATPEPVLATYSWVFVTIEGDVVAATQVSYDTLEDIPSLPE